MVPSWTETLLTAGINVVGRTRFCIHPQERARQIPVVGGTKDWDLSSVKRLSADLLVFDKEENPKWMSDQSPVPWIATHVQSVENISEELHRLGTRLINADLIAMASRWKTLTKMRLAPEPIENLPGVQHWIRKPDCAISTILYLIWNNPLMAVSRDTFIGSVFEHTSGGRKLPEFSEKYPKIELKSFDPMTTLLLCSTEPFPFHRIKDDLAGWGFPVALVNGEDFSWFGVRTFRFLESLQ